MFSIGRQDLRRGFTHCARIGFVLGLMAVTPLALGQKKMYKCPDGKGGTTIQQFPCPETADEVAAREKEKERLKVEEARKKEEDARKKAEGAAKAKERDAAYQKQMEERAQEALKTQEAEKKLLEGTALEKSDGSLTPEVEKFYPGPWKDGNPAITAALLKANVKNCDKFRHRARAGGGANEFMVQCTTDGGKSWATQYFVWIASGAVKGPFKL